MLILILILMLILIPLKLHCTVLLRYSKYGFIVEYVRTLGRSLVAAARPGRDFTVRMT
jgi:hypothetical protein